MPTNHTRLLQIFISPTSSHWALEIELDKKKAKNNPQTIFSNPRIIVLNNRFPNSPSLTSAEFLKEKETMVTFFFLNTEDAVSLLRVRVRCPKQKRPHQSLVCFATWSIHQINSRFLENIFTYENGILGAVLLMDRMDANSPSFALI